MTPKVCNTCKHLKMPAMTCPAFPNGIPMNLLSGDLEHTQILPGQTGKTVWQARTQKKGKGNGSN